jgi:hypothetical protein
MSSQFFSCNLNLHGDFLCGCLSWDFMIFCINVQFYQILGIVSLLFLGYSCIRPT